MKVSIIIPIYNAETYLAQCLDSLLNQTYENIEIILVNDGSTDGSNEICKQYVQKDSRVRLYFQKNAGVSVARNTGISNSTGNYILFVDSDDWVDKDYVNLMIEKLNKYDSIICGYTEEYVNERFYHKAAESIITENSAIAIKKVINNTYGGYIYNKAFKKEIISKYNIRFHNDIHMCEDMLFVIEYLKKCNNIYVLNKCLYNYRMRKSSAVWQKGDKYLTIFRAYDLIENSLNNDSFIELINYRKLFSYFTLNSSQKLKIDISKREIKKMLSDVMNSKLISKKNKLKLFFLKKNKFIYNGYLFLKINKYKRYD